MKKYVSRFLYHRVFIKNHCDYILAIFPFMAHAIFYAVLVFDPLLNMKGLLYISPLFILSIIGIYRIFKKDKADYNRFRKTLDEADSFIELYHNKKKKEEQKVWFRFYFLMSDFRIYWDEIEKKRDSNNTIPHI